MYSKKSWGGDKDPLITVLFPKSENDADVVSLLIFEYTDEPYIGVRKDGKEDTDSDSDDDEYAVVSSSSRPTPLALQILAADITGAVARGPKLHLQTRRHQSRPLQNRRGIHNQQEPQRYRISVHPYPSRPALQGAPNHLRD